MASPDAIKPLHDAKGRATKRPDSIVTDGLQGYRKAIRDEFFDNTARIINPHVRLKDFETKPNNNIVERLNGTFRERLKVMRGLSTNDGADEFMEGMRVYYNYIRPHQALNNYTPAHFSNIYLDLGDKKWENLLMQSVKNNRGDTSSDK